MSTLHSTNTPDAAAPHVFFPAVKIPQPDGSYIVKPGKPIVDGEIRVAEFAKLTGMSASRIGALCAAGEIQCRRLSSAPKSRFVIPYSELERFLNIRVVSPKQTIKTARQSNATLGRKKNVPSGKLCARQRLHNRPVKG